MSSPKWLTLPVLLAIATLTLRTESVRGRKIQLFDDLNMKIDIGNLEAELTTVGRLKEIVAYTIEGEVDSIVLSRDYENPFMDDNELVSNYFQDVYDVKVILCDDLTHKGTIYVFLNKTSFGIAATKNKTLAWLKKELIKEDNPDLYKVFFEGLELQEDSKTLGEYKLYEGASVSLIRNDDRFRVTVIVPQFLIKLNVGINTTIGDLKKLIEDQGYGMDNRMLLHHDTVVADDRKLMSYSKRFYLGMKFRLVHRLSESGAILEMFYRKVGFLQHFSVYVIPNNTVGDLKRYAFKVDSSIPVDRMILKFANQILDDDSRKLEDYHFYPSAPVYIERNLTELINTGNDEGDHRSSLVEPAEPASNFHGESSKSSDIWNLLTPSKDDQQDNENDCWICYEDMTTDDGKPTITTGCGHKFHQNCLQGWINSVKNDYFNCPSCRCELNTTCLQPRNITPSEPIQNL